MLAAISFILIMSVAKMALSTMRQARELVEVENDNNIVGDQKLRDAELLTEPLGGRSAWVRFVPPITFN